jgi:hypothetical protein
VRLALLAAAATASLAWAATAVAAITVDVTAQNGAPVVGETVTLSDANGGFVGLQSTNAAGRAVFPSPNPSFKPPPYTAEVSVLDNCRTYTDSSREAQASGISDGQTVALQVDAYVLCAQGYTPPGLPDPTGLVDLATGRILVPPGGTVDVNVLAPFGAQNAVVTAGTGGPALNAPVSGDQMRLTAPAGGYEGPLQLSFTFNSQQVSFQVGTMVSRAVGRPVQLPGPIDLEAIVDVSGSMGGNDPAYIRRDAVGLLVDLARPGDKLGAVGFDDRYRPIFGLTTITGSPAVANRLKALARSRIRNLGGTDYNDGMDKAYEALTATPGVDPNRQKGIIFLTDGGHGSGVYGNGHLRFAYNASGRPWPVCAIQLGHKSSFQAADVARLKRIARETGGQYFATTKADDLADIYFRCFGLTTGQRAIGATTTFVFRAGQQKQLRRRVPAGLPQATFFVTWGNGRYQVVLIDPRGRRHTAALPGTGTVFRRGATFAFFRVTKPRAGSWTVQIKNLRLTTPTDRARASVTAPRRR